MIGRDGILRHEMKNVSRGGDSTDVKKDDDLRFSGVFNTNQGVLGNRGVERFNVARQMLKRAGAQRRRSDEWIVKDKFQRKLRGVNSIEFIQETIAARFEKKTARRAGRKGISPVCAVHFRRQGQNSLRRRGSEIGRAHV